MHTIEAKDLRVKDFLHAHSIRLKPGIYGIIGTNGAGKTTLMRAIAGHLPMTSGSIETAPTALARTGADILLAGHTVKDHLHIAQKARGELDIAYANRLLARFELHPSEVCSRLSTGKRQLIANITVLAARTPDTLMDEPFTGLDVPTREVLRQVIIEHASHNDDWTLLLSSHRAEDLAGLVEGLIVVQKGRAVGPLLLDEQRELYPLFTGESSAVDDAVAALTGSVVSQQKLGRTSRVRVQLAEPLNTPLHGIDTDFPDDVQLIDSLVSAQL